MVMQGAMVLKCRRLALASTLWSLVATALLRSVAGSEPVCREQARIRGKDTKPGDFFGGQISASGDTVVTVAANEDGKGSNSGAAYVFTREGVKWSQQAKLVANATTTRHHFGRSVGVSGDTAVISSRTGTAYVFTRKETTYGPMWFEMAELVADEPEMDRMGDEFGKSVAVSGGLVAVGATNGNRPLGYGAGAVYVFTIREGKWTQEVKLQGKDTKMGHYFGVNVAISGTTLAVGTDSSPVAYTGLDGWKKGTVYIFTRSTTGVTSEWSQQATLYGEGVREGDQFGASVAIYHNTIAVGAPGDDTDFTDAGAVYIFKRQGTTWTQAQKISAAVKGEGHMFGFKVGVSESTLAVVAKGSSETSGSEENYEGMLYVFKQNETSPSHEWSDQIKWEGSKTMFGDRFGASIAVSGDYVTAGAPRENTGGEEAGSAYFLKCVTTTTSTTTTNVAPSTTSTPLNLTNQVGVTNAAQSHCWMTGVILALFMCMPRI